QKLKPSRTVPSHAEYVVDTPLKSQLPVRVLARSTRKDEDLSEKNADTAEPATGLAGSTLTEKQKAYLEARLGCAALLSQQADAFYLPGIAPHDYKIGEKVDLQVNSLTPSLNAENKLESVLSYNYYDERFHFCRPQGGPKAAHESLGSILFGDRIYNSAFELEMLKDSSCQMLCAQTIPGKDAAFINDKIMKGYNYNWLIDGLPAATVKIEDRLQKEFYSLGFELGSQVAGQIVPHFYNHYDITVQYHTVDSVHHRVVGVI
ncbi:Transmembrane 9 super member 2, partial [Coemansia erecta]